MTAPAATSLAVRTSELRRFGGGCVVGRSAAARQARLVAAMAQTIPCWGIRMVVVVKCCQHCAATLILIDVARACSQNLRASGWGGALLALRCVVDVAASNSVRGRPPRPIPITRKLL